MLLIAVWQNKFANPPPDQEGVLFYVGVSYPQQKSNPHMGFRKAQSCPLNDGDIWYSRWELDP